MAGQNQSASHNTMYLVYGALFTIVALAALVALVLVTSRTDTDTTQQQAAITGAAPVVDAPTIAASYGGTTIGSALDLTAEGTKTLSIHGAVADNNGCEDLDTVGNWTVAFYRTNFSGGSACSATNASCYQDTEEAAGLTGCTGGGSDLNIDYDFTVEVVYYADATDSGSSPDYSATNWTAYVNVIDEGGLSGNNSTTIDVNTLKGVSATASINYGTLALSGTSVEKTITITNTGNDNDLDPTINQSGAWVCATNPLGTILPATVQWSKTAAFSYDGVSATAITGSAVDLSNLSIAKSTGSASTSNIYLLMKLPSTGVGGTGCTSTLTITGA